jgi:hypothetical protein
VAVLLDRSDVNAPNQATVFTSQVKRAKDETLDDLKRTDVKATFTVDSPIPYDLDALVVGLKDLDTQMVQGTRSEKQGEWFGKLTRFIARLEARLSDRRYGFMFACPSTCMLYDWMAKTFTALMAKSAAGRGIKIIDLSEVPGDILPVVAGVFARLNYDIQFWMKP